jgi:hypothetical protein
MAYNENAKKKMDDLGVRAVSGTLHIPITLAHIPLTTCPYSSHSPHQKNLTIHHMEISNP